MQSILSAIKKKTFRIELVTLVLCRSRNNDKEIVVKETKVVTDLFQSRDCNTANVHMIDQVFCHYFSTLK